MKKMMLLALLAILFVILFTACRFDLELDSGDNVHIADEIWTQDEDWTEEISINGLPVGEYTYIRSIIPFEHNISEVSIITVSNETVYGAVAIWGSDMLDSKILFFYLVLDTEDIFFYPPSTNLTGGGNNVHAITANSVGEIFYVNHKFLYNDETPTTEEILLLTQIDTLGNIGFSIDITEYLGFSEHNDWITPPYAIMLDDTGNINVIANDGSVSQFDSTGNYQFSVQHPEGTWTQAVGIPFQGTNGNLLFPIWDSHKGNILFFVDIDTRSLIPHQPLPEAHAFSPSLDGNELFMITDAGVYSYCLESGERSRVFHWLEVGAPVSFVFPAGEGLFALMDYSDSSRFHNAIGLLTRTAVQDDTRTVVTMASLSPNLRLVNEFNRQSTEYRIVVLDYSNNDIATALTRFNADMIAGKTPDIIDFAYLDYRNLATGGFLTDLNAWFDHDNYISRTNFHERVFELLEVDGNLYAVAPSFLITTYLAPASLVGTTPGMTLDRLMQLDVQFNDGNSLLQSEFSRLFIDMHTMVSRSALIDFDMGVARFETNDFIQVLEYASRLEQSEVIAPNDERAPFEINIRRGNNLISQVTIYHLGELYQIESYAGTEITPIGFPIDDGVGSLMLPVTLFGIGEGAHNPSGAWAFLRFLLTTMQDEMHNGIPVSRTLFDEWAKRSMNPPPIEDNPHLSNEIFIDGVLIELTPITQDQVNRTLEMIETLGGILVDGDELVANIVAEEVSAFLRGHRSAEDTARIIQNRVQIYVAEQHR